MKCKLAAKEYKSNMDMLNTYHKWVHMGFYVFKILTSLTVPVTVCAKFNQSLQSSLKSDVEVMLHGTCFHNQTHIHTVHNMNTHLVHFPLEKFQRRRGFMTSIFNSASISYTMMKTHDNEETGTE